MEKCSQIISGIGEAVFNSLMHDQRSAQPEVEIPT
jgi:hypothetical protein